MFRNSKWIEMTAGFVIVLSLFASQMVYASQVNATEVNETKLNDSEEIIAEEIEPEEIVTEEIVTEEIGVGEIETGKEHKTIVANYSEYMEKSALKDVQWNYLRNDSLSIDGAKGTLVEFLVSNGQAVKKGDMLLSYQLPYDSIALEEMKLSLERKESEYRKLSEQKEKDIADKWNQFQLMDYSTTKAQILALNIKKSEVEYQQFQNQSLHSLDDLKVTLKELEAKIELQYIQAPYDGVVWFNDDFKEGSILEPYYELIYINDMKGIILGTTITGVNKFWYGLEVSVTGISNMKEDKINVYKGKVIAIDSVLNGKASTGMIYIQSEEEDLFSTMQRANLTAEAVFIENVLVIPLNVVKFENEMSYVYILDDNDEVRKQYITGRDNGTDMWVYTGLSEGQRIILE